MEIVIGIVAYLLIGLTILAIMITDDEIDLEISELSIVLMWPLIAVAFGLAVATVVICVAVDKLTGGL